MPSHLVGFGQQRACRRTLWALLALGSGSGTAVQVTGLLALDWLKCAEVRPAREQERNEDGESIKTNRGRKKGFPVQRDASWLTYHTSRASLTLARLGRPTLAHDPFSLSLPVRVRDLRSGHSSGPLTGLAAVRRCSQMRGKRASRSKPIFGREKIS